MAALSVLMSIYVKEARFLLKSLSEIIRELVFEQRYLENAILEIL